VVSIYQANIERSMIPLGLSGRFSYEGFAPGNTEKVKKTFKCN